jgi:DNA-binding MarR family transcriptional regulator
MAAMSNSLSDLLTLISGVRRSFWLLGSVSDQILFDLGLTASLRAVLEHLASEGPQTVPQIAQAKHVKRQSIQALVDELCERGLTETLENPSHKRSVLIALTKAGAATYREIRALEKGPLTALLRDLDGHDLEGAADALREMCDALVKRMEGER